MQSIARKRDLLRVNNGIDVKNERCDTSEYLRGCGFRKIAKIMSKLFRKDYRWRIVMYWIKGLVQENQKIKQGKGQVLQMDDP